MTCLPKGAYPVRKETVELIAFIIGPSSAASAALQEATRCGGAVRFWQSGSSIIVEKIQKESTQP